MGSRTHFGGILGREGVISAGVPRFVGSIRHGGWSAGRREEMSVYDQFDVTLEDGDLLHEVELTTTLIIAASESEERMTPEQIDALLGVLPIRPRRPGDEG